MEITLDYPKTLMKVYLNQVATFRTVGYVIGDLQIGWTDNTFKSISVYNAYGYRVSNIQLKTWEDAEAFAKFLSEHYHKYFLLWNENEQADVPGLTRYTIEDGLKIYDALERLSGKIVTMSEIRKEVDNA